jgi:hypothetical protein
MSEEDIPLPWKVRILDLEDQVRGLRETVNKFYKFYHLTHMGVPVPDQYIQTPPANGYTMADVEARMAAMDLRPLLPISDGAPEVAVLVDTTAEAEATAAMEDMSLDAVFAETETKAAAKFTPDEVSNLPLYTYSPLDESSAEVRFLALTTSSESTEDDPISCRIITASLDDVPTSRPFSPSSALELYNPLSYCWGTAEATKEIVIDGCLFQVRPSLHEALAHFRSTKLVSSDPFWCGAEDTKETFWWVDAICINQDDVEERKSQVALMSRLYRSAHTVRVWLGQEEDDSALAMDIVRKLAYRPETPEEEASWEYLKDNPGKTQRPGGAGRTVIKITQPDAGPPVSDLERAENYEALVKLFQRPWFSRVWIQQEAALPENVEVHCGQETCSWETLMSTADMLAYFVDECHLPGLQTALLREDASSFRSCFSKARAIGELRKEFIDLGGSYGEFEALITGCRNCQATDPRDKVYALLPMTDPDAFELKADYTQDKKASYMAMVNKFLERDSLTFMEWCQDPTRSSGLPSWVPDLEAPWNPLPVERHHEDITYTCDDESSGTHAPVEAEYIESEDKLQVKGIIFDHVGVINEDAFVTGSSSNEEMSKIARHWQRFDSDQREKLEGQWRSEKRAQKAKYRDLSEYEDYDDDDDYSDDHDYNIQDKSEQHFSIYGNLTTVEGDDWVDRMTGHIRNRDLSRHNWDDDHYGDFDPADIDNDPILKIFQRYLPMGKSRLSEFLGRKKQFYPWFRSVTVGRRFMVTSKGGSGLVPEHAEVGDALCYFAGCATPFVIRSVGAGDWVIVGVPRKFFLPFSNVLTMYCYANYVDFSVTIALHSMGLGLEPRTISLV